MADRSKQGPGLAILDYVRSEGPLVNSTGGWSVFGAGLICEEALEAMACAGRVSVVMPDVQARLGAAIASAFEVEAAFVTNCAAAGLAITAAAALVLRGQADPSALPWSPPKRRKILLPKGHALNFSAQVTQMIGMAGAAPVEMGAVNACPAAVVERACRDEDVAAAVYVQSTEAFPYGVAPLEQFVQICRAADVPVIVDAAAQPLSDPILRCRPDILILSPHKLMGSPTAGIILGSAEIVKTCRDLESSFGRPFKAGKETWAGAAAAVQAWRGRAEGVVNEVWRQRADHAADRFRDIDGLRFETFHYPAPLQGVHARLLIDRRAFGMDAVELAERLLNCSRPRVAVTTEEAAHGALLIHFGMLDEREIDLFADAVRAIRRQASPSRDSVDQAGPN